MGPEHQMPGPLPQTARSVAEDEHSFRDLTGCLGKLLKTFLKISECLFCVLVFCLHICLCTICSAPEAKRRHQIPCIGVTDGCEPLYECRELIQGLLEEHPAH